MKIEDIKMIATITKSIQDLIDTDPIEDDDYVLLSTIADVIFSAEYDLNQERQEHFVDIKKSIDGHFRDKRWEVGSINVWDEDDIGHVRIKIKTDLDNEYLTFHVHDDDVLYDDGNSLSDINADILECIGESIRKYYQSASALNKFEELELEFEHYIEGCTISINGIKIVISSIETEISQKGQLFYYEHDICNSTVEQTTNYSATLRELLYYNDIMKHVQIPMTALEKHNWLIKLIEEYREEETKEDELATKIEIQPKKVKGIKGFALRLFKKDQVTD